MRLILTASKDATIYQAFKNNNSGLDELLEIGKVINTNVDVTSSTAYSSGSARTLLYFDLPTTTTVPATASYFLNLKLANANKVNRNQKLVIYQVSQSWDEGSAFFYQNIKNSNDGVTWLRCTPFTSWSNAGGDYLTGSVSQSITLSSYPLQDIKVDVTNILQPIVSQSLQNTFHGLVVQFPTQDEIDNLNEGNIKVFSTQTHTIHQPTLEVAWDNQQFTTGTFTKIPSTLEIKVVPSNIQEKYSKGDVARIDLVVRDPYPLKSFDSTLRYKNKYYLPSSSYYSIIDSQANVPVIPFDNYSKINCDTLGAYIVLDTSPLYPGRFYSLKFKITSGSYTKTIDPNIEFQVI